MTVGWELYERTHNAGSLALVGVFELIPVLALFVPAGWVIDRVARRHIAMGAQFLASAAGFGLAAVAFTHGPLAVIYALLVLLGTARAFGAPAVATLLPQLLERQQFVHANAWLSTAFELASITGPAIGGFLIALNHRAFEAYLVGGGCQLLFVLLLFALPLKPPAKTEGRSPGGLWSGVRFIFKNQVFLAAITLDLFAVLLGGAVALLPIYAKDVLNVGPEGLGWLRAAPSLGAMAMALLTTRLPPWKSPGHVLLVVVALFGAATIGFGLSKNFALSLVCLFFTGVFDNISVVIRLTM
jgi:MFS family permease